MQLESSQVLRQYFKTVPSVEYEDLSWKTVVVTGANNGIGYEATKHFARMNPDRLIMACRSKERGEAAVNTELWIVDLAQIFSVVEFADRFEKEGARLDILLENAGIGPTHGQQLTTDGYEPAFQVNNLCSSFLALCLLPTMLRTAKKHYTIPRIIIISSEVHYWTKLEKYVVDSPNGLEKFGKLEYSEIKQDRYVDSKLLNVFFTRGLSERLRDKHLIVNSINPNYCYSLLRSRVTGVRAWAYWLLEIAIARTSKEGSLQLIWTCIGGKNNISELHVQEPSDCVISEEGKRAQTKLRINNSLSSRDRISDNHTFATRTL